MDCQLVDSGSYHNYETKAEVLQHPRRIDKISFYFTAGGKLISHRWRPKFQGHGDEWNPFSESKLNQMSEIYKRCTDQSLFWVQQDLMVPHQHMEKVVKTYREKNLIVDVNIPENRLDAELLKTLKKENPDVIYNLVWEDRSKDTHLDISGLYYTIRNNDKSEEFEHEELAAQINMIKTHQEFLDYINNTF